MQLRKKYFIQEAVTNYTQGLAVSPGDLGLRSLLHSNRAQAHLKLGNNRKALEDGLAAIKLDGTAVKVSQVPSRFVQHILGHALQCASKSQCKHTTGIQDQPRTIQCARMSPIDVVSWTACCSVAETWLRTGTLCRHTIAQPRLQQPWRTSNKHRPCWRLGSNKRLMPMSCRHSGR